MLQNMFKWTDASILVRLARDHEERIEPWFYTMGEHKGEIKHTGQDELHFRKVCGTDE